MNSRSTARLAIPDLIELSLQAAANQDVYGSVSQLAREYGVSRRMVRAIRDDVVETLTRAATQASCITKVAVTRGHLARCIIALYMVGRCSIWSIVDLLPILFPGVKGGGFGTVQRLLVDAAKRAQKFNAAVDLSAVSSAGLDEMFSQGEPVLAGICLDTNYVFAAEKRAQRRILDWQEVLSTKKEQGLRLRVAVRDGGASIKSGVTAVFPDAEQRDDNLHAQMVVTKIISKVENRAYATISRIDTLEASLAKAEKRTKPNLLRIASLKEQLKKKKQRCEQLMTEHEELTKTWEKLRRGLEMVDVNQGTLRDGDTMRREVDSVAETLMASKRRDCRQAGKYIKRRVVGLTNYADSAHTRLAPLMQEFGRDAVVTAMTTAQLADRLRRVRKAPRREQVQQLKLYLSKLEATGHGDELLGAVAEVLYGRHRASSAIESMNAALRLHLTIRKRATEGFLHLFQAYFNLRVRRWGRFKGTSAWGLLTGQPAGDWLTHLGYPPAH